MYFSLFYVYPCEHLREPLDVQALYYANTPNINSGQLLNKREKLHSWHLLTCKQGMFDLWKRKGNYTAVFQVLCIQSLFRAIVSDNVCEEDRQSPAFFKMLAQLLEVLLDTCSYSMIYTSVRKLSYWRVSELVSRSHLNSLAEADRAMNSFCEQEAVCIHFRENHFRK